MLQTLFLVGIGGGIGSILRYLTSVFVSRYFPQHFPWATFAANFLGCLMIGMLIGFFGRQQPDNHRCYLLLVTGFCGGYTTFSTFSLENIQLLQSGNVSVALLYIFGSISCGLAATWLGMCWMK